MCANQTAVVQPRLIPSQLPCGLKYSSSSSGTPILLLWVNRIGISSTRSVVTFSCSAIQTAYRIFKILSPFDRTVRYKPQNKSNITLVKREDILDLRNKWSQALNLKEVTDWMGLSEGTVPKLVQIGLLKAQQTTEEGGYWMFNPSEVAECLEHIVARVVV